MIAERDEYNFNDILMTLPFGLVNDTNQSCSIIQRTATATRACTQYGNHYNIKNESAKHSMQHAQTETHYCYQLIQFCSVSQQHCHTQVIAVSFLLKMSPITLEH